MKTLKNQIAECRRDIKAAFSLAECRQTLSAGQLAALEVLQNAIKVYNFSPNDENLSYTAGAAAAAIYALKEN
jgi:hypothetical protein